MDIKEMLNDFRDLFEEKISAKNSWGKNEVRDIFRECLTDVMIAYINTK